MVISYYGLGMVKVVQGDTTIAFNPIGETKDYKSINFGSDIALVSVNDPHYNGIDHMSRGDRVPFVVDGPGEYEVSGIFVRGLGTRGPREKINTIYSLVLDEIRLAHLGALTEPLTPETVEKLGVVDVLFVPVGGGGTLEAKQAAKMVTTLNPKIVIPVDYDDDKMLHAFLKEVGSENGKPVESLTIRRKDVADKETVVVVIQSN
jgi:L-ascorbate metabolism protein UlaG (beta-lactamase superfamily)